jgi:DNA damage-binding protein 1
MCTAWCAIDRERFLLADNEGGLHVLLLASNSTGDAVTALKLEFLGVTSIAHKLQYVDNGFVMVGSIYGDSQLIRLHQSPMPAPDDEAEAEADEDGAAAMDVDAASSPAAASSSSGAAAAAAAAAKRPNFISVESTFDNLGPIVDFGQFTFARAKACVLRAAGWCASPSLFLTRLLCDLCSASSVQRCLTWSATVRVRC